jgi:RNA polymerase-interacting CarD/CdnL/TRCF family regulator
MSTEFLEMIRQAFEQGSMSRSREFKTGTEKGKTGDVKSQERVHHFLWRKAEVVSSNYIS